ncbi:catechol 2,3-dioxygenase-like lactoylglutathione lyase family enzyme [Neobacillus sp. B4I6]|jgi:catechol 2,3-dioxygenase-like lactoylglutathione lyase family enzyme|uniref:VOC family protein n=1 Tax=Neobacillus sp. B4I6 TaxID=3373925 RepID=UPI003D229D7D
MLHHLEIYVSSLSKTIEFWGWFLTEIGYEPFQKWESGFSWKHGETYIVFVQADDRFLDIPYHRSRVGLNHLAFQAVSREQVNQMTLQLKEKGVNILYPDKHPFAGGGSHYAVFFEDPDRIKVELVAP